MGNGTGICSIGVEDDTIGTGRTTGVDVSVLQNGEFLVRTGDGEVEAFAVVERVRVVVVSDLLAVVVVRDSLVQGGADAGGSVLVAATGGGGLTGDDDASVSGEGGGGGDGADCEEQSGAEEGELHLVCLVGGVVAKRVDGWMDGWMSAAAVAVVVAVWCEREGGREWDCLLILLVSPRLCLSFSYIR